MLTKKLKEILTRHEELRLWPYLCPAGKRTIGVGRNLDDKGLSKEEIAMLLDEGISEKVAEMLLDNDIADAIKECNQKFPWFDGLNEARTIVVISMVFNMGMPRFLGFRKTIGHIEAGRFGAAADEMLDSRWARQVGRRATELAQMMRDGG
jgi:lysozyme